MIRAGGGKKPFLDLFLQDLHYIDEHTEAFILDHVKSGLVANYVQV